jgi:hypothetical protein
MSIKHHRGAKICLAPPGSHYSHLSEESQASHRSSISFGPIEVREFARIVGDHPDVSSGPPMALGWEYIQDDPITVDEYEKKNKGRSRGPIERTTKFERILILHHEFGFPMQELRDAEKEAKRTQLRRTNSKKSHNLLYECSESIALAIVRKAKSTCKSILH